MSVGYDDSPEKGTIELDTHADTFVGGSNCIMLPDSETGDKATVHSFSDESRPFREIPIGSLATAWVDPDTSATVILVFNEGLYFGDRLDHSLLCPNQLRANGVEVKDAPTHLDSNSPHHIRSEQDKLKIPLRLRGVISLFDTHKPTDDELMNCRQVHLTSDSPWDPYDPSFAAQEHAAQFKLRNVSTVHQNGDSEVDGDFLDSFETHSLRCDREEQLIELLDEDTLTKRFVSAVNISYCDCAEHILAGSVPNHCSCDLSLARKASPVVYGRDPSVTKELLSQRWGIGLDTAHRTLKTTTQRGFRTRLHPSDRRVSTRRPHLSFPMIKTKMYTDTSFAKVKSTI